MRYFREESGQTLLELLMVVGLMSLLLTMLVSMVTTSTARNRESERKVVATRLAQEGAEWIRGERDRLGWSEFLGQIGNTADWCLDDVANELSISYTPPIYVVNCPSDEVVNFISPKYFRRMILTRTPASIGVLEKYHISLEVNWEGNNTQSVKLETDLYKR